jgi:hypothetical protein
LKVFIESKCLSIQFYRPNVRRVHCLGSSAQR